MEGSRKVSRTHGKLTEGHAATQKVAEGPPATLKVNRDFRRHAESRLKLTEGPADAQNVDRISHVRSER